MDEEEDRTESEDIDYQEMRKKMQFLQKLLNALLKRKILY